MKSLISKGVTKRYKDYKLAQAIYVNEISEMETIKNLEHFEETEFGDGGHVSDHSEYQDSSSVEDELD